MSIKSRLSQFSLSGARHGLTMAGATLIAGVLDYLYNALTGRWLDPVDGRGWRISAVGAAAVLLGYAVTLAVFATARGLQYWDYSS